jgi:hypothetical protein
MCSFTASALVWFSNLFMYLELHFFISLTTVFFCRSAWILWLFMYQGAFRMDRRVLDWERWRISMLEFEVVSDCLIPQVQMSLSAALYRRSLLFY